MLRDGLLGLLLLRLGGLGGGGGRLGRVRLGGSLAKGRVRVVRELLLQKVTQEYKRGRSASEIRNNQHKQVKEETYSVAVALESTVSSSKSERASLLLSGAVLVSLVLNRLLLLARLLLLLGLLLLAVVRGGVRLLAVV